MARRDLRARRRFGTLRTMINIATIVFVLVMIGAAALSEPPTGLDG